MMSKGNAGFIGRLLAGFVSGYITLYVKQIANKIIPKSLQSINPVLTYPFFSVLISESLTYLLLSPISFINEGMLNFLNGLSSRNMALLGAIIGKMMSVDMGGPINKAAYAFGIAMITSGNYCTSFKCNGQKNDTLNWSRICTTFFKNKFSTEEQESGKVCYIFGACFITEGVIPFSASTPLKVIPSCILGSAL